ncbi:MAG: hypothetical protein IKD86_03630, partial [Firmicutes bacterium]|nr:hypothetical protein [Bacillota bacterium]
GINEDRDITDISADDERFLDYLYDHGANIDLYGVDELAEPPLFAAAIYQTDRLFKWLSDHGADPKAEILYDEPFLNDSSYSIADWIEAHT